MAESTSIEWCDHTWSPWEGCTRVSLAASGGGGCDHCYAEAMNRWLRRGENWGPGAPRLEFSEAHWAKPVRWNKRAAKSGLSRKVFPSMCDPFDNEVRSELRARFFRLIESTPHLTWLLLTKRIGNANRMIVEARGSDRPPLANLWIGATIVNRAEMLRDAPKLKATPAVRHFWSYEPALGPLGEIPIELMPDWVICGGESGRQARPMHPDWPRQVRDQCEAAKVPFLFKQHGEWREPEAGESFNTALGRAQKMPAFIVSMAGTVHCFENEQTRDGKTVIRVTKKVAGRLLDGVEHNGVPNTEENRFPEIGAV